MEAYTWVARQIGTRGVWEPYQLAGLPYPPAIDDKITIQRWATSACRLGDVHKSSFVLDFDAHADWLSLELCRDEVRRFLEAFSRRWRVAPATFAIAFSGRAGFHVTIPETLLGDVASPLLTTAYKHWATAIKDGLGLITLDAPSRKPVEWWWNRISSVLGRLPPSILDRDAFALSLRRVGIYTRRRMIRREGSQHPRSELYKIPLLLHELTLHTASIRALAIQPRERRATIAPPAHPGLATHLQHLLASMSARTPYQPPEQLSDAETDDDADKPWDDVLIQDDDPPPCVRRILGLPAPEGSSNMPLINVLAYWRLRRIPEPEAIERASRWLLRGIADPARQRERQDSARSIGRAVYEHRYQFRRHFIVPLQIVTDDDCAACLLRDPCNGATS